MPTVIGHHNISKDTKHWLSSPKRKELFGSLGITNIRTFVDPQNPKRVAIMMDVPDMDALRPMMQSKAAADSMDSRWRCAGVAGDPGRIEGVAGHMGCHNRILVSGGRRREMRLQRLIGCGSGCGHRIRT